MKKFFMFSVVFLLLVACATPAFSAMSDSEFFALCKTGTPQQVQAAINAGANVNVRNKNGQTPIMFAAFENSNHEVIAALIKSGADVHARDKDGVTPLIFAAWNNSNPEVISALIKSGVDVNARSENGATALGTAANNKTAAKDKIMRVLTNL